MSAVEVISHRAAIGGYVSDASSGTGIAGASVEITSVGQQAQARADGFYCFLDLPDGAYTLRATAPASGSRYGAVTVAGITVGGTVSGSPVLDPKSNLSLPPTRLTGLVRRGDTQAPIAYADVQLRASNVTVKSGKTGQYAHSAVEAGTQTVQVAAPGFNTVSQSVTLNAGQETVVNFTLVPS